MVRVSDIPESEIEFSAIRASGPGGQNVNKVSSAIHLRFDVMASSLPEAVKSKLLKMRDARISSDGVIVIKAQKFRSQEKNRLESLKRLDELLQKSQYVDKLRRETRPSRSSVRKRLDSKKKQGSVKKNRGKVDDY
jgi:ribosome-associated protein